MDWIQLDFGETSMQNLFGKVAKLATVALIVAFGFGMAGGPAQADEASIKYRQSVMKSIGGHMGALAAVIKGQAGAKSHLPGHANAVAAMAASAKDLFPKGSDAGAETAALPVIWEKPDEFAKAVVAFETASANFAGIAGGGDMQAIAAAFGDLGKSCGGCHQTYRKKN
jgi:cytochrome c556